MSKIFDLFAATNTANLPDNRGSFNPPSGPYTFELSKGDIIMKEDGMKYTDKATNQEVVKPTLTFRYRIVEGEYADRTFYEQYIVEIPEQIENPDIREMAAKTLGRLKGNLEVFLGYEVPNLGAALAEAENILNTTGSVVFQGRVNTFTNKKGRTNTSVYLDKVLSPGS